MHHRSVMRAEPPELRVDAQPLEPLLEAEARLLVCEIGPCRRALDAGAKSLSAPVDQPHGDRAGAVADRFGNFWFIATHFKDVI